MDKTTTVFLKKTGKTCEAALEGENNNLIVCIRRRMLN
jgi:hypothetical protein